MSATSATGTGNGSVRQTSTSELLTNFNSPPNIIFANSIEVTNSLSSPPSSQNTVTFPYTLQGGANNYVVILTTLNAGYAYVSSVEENSDGEFTGFTAIAESEGTLMYMVVKKGSRISL